ncbi:YvcK family protein [Candidatus Woesebacteria bacterium]|nr:YvcK family protein [Candidatus Woesebacteria bacterium]
MRLIQAQQLRVTTIGGGTGTYPVVAALRTLPVDISCIVAVSDSGGSSARLKDEFGFPPVGDLRQSLTALADPKTQALLQQLLLYRFEKGTGLRGHSLGNLILTALQDMTGSTTTALADAAQLFQFNGRVIPVTEDTIDLEVHYIDGSVRLGEHELDDPKAPTTPIKRIRLVPKPKTSTTALKTIALSDHIIIGPGDLYASLEAVLVAPRVAATLRKGTGNVTYIINIMTRRSQTAHMSAADHVQEIEKVIGRPLTNIIINTAKPTAAQLKPYRLVGEAPVIDDLGSDKRVVRAPLLTQTKTAPQSADAVPRSVLRHDSQRLRQILKKIVTKK